MLALQTLEKLDYHTECLGCEQQRYFGWVEERGPRFRSAEQHEELESSRRALALTNPGAFHSQQCG